MSFGPSGGAPINIGSIMADLRVDSSHMERGLANARRAMDAIKNEVHRLQAELNQGTITGAAFQARMLALADTMQRLQTAMNAAYSATQKLHTGLEIVNASSAKFAGARYNQVAFGLMQVGYIVDDLQYSFQAAVNNIGPLVMGFTGNAGIAAAAQIGAVAVNYLYTHWTELMDAMGIGKVRSEAEEFEYLAQKVHKSADEVARYKKMKEEVDKIEHLKNSKSDFDSERSHAAEHLIKETGFGKLQNALITAKTAEGTLPGIDEEDLQKEYDKRRSGRSTLNKVTDSVEDFFLGASPKPKIDPKRLEEIRQEKAVRQAQKLIAQLANGDTGAIDQILALAGKYPKLFNGIMDIDEIRKLKPEYFQTKGMKAKDAKDAQESEERANKEEQHQRQMVHKAREDLPGVEDVIKEDIGQRLARGESREKIFKAESDRIRNGLMARGWEKSQAQKTADRLNENIGEDFEKDRIRQVIRDRSPEGIKKRRREQVEEAKKAAPGIEDVAEASIVQSLGQGMKRDEIWQKVNKQIKDELMRAGFDEKKASEAAEDINAKAGQDVKGDIVNRALRGGKEQEHRQSEVMSGAEIGAKVQSAIGKEDKKVTLLERIRELLADQYRFQMQQNNGAVTVKVKK